MPLFFRFGIVFVVFVSNAFAQEPVQGTELRQISITFKQGVGIKPGAPVFWRRERVGSVTASKHNRELHHYVVEASIKAKEIPASLAAILVIQGEDEKKGPSLRIELLPSTRPPQDTIPGYGSFEEFWLVRGSKSGR